MIRWVLILLLFYVLAYAAYRVTATELRALDGEHYVIYPEGSLAYILFRPLAYADAALTGQKSHIGPHPEEIPQ